MTAATPNVAHSMRGPVLFWAAFSALALSYLAVVKLKPELLGAWGPRAEVSHEVATATTTPSAAAEAEALRQTIAQLKTDLEDMKAVVAASEEREKAIVARLATVERPPGVASGPASPGESPIVTSSIRPLADAGRPAGRALDTPAEPAAATSGESRAVVTPTVISATLADDAADASGPGKAAARKGGPPAAKAPADAPAAKASARKAVAAATPPSPADTDAGREPSFAASVAPAPPAAGPAPKAAGRGHSYGVQLASGPSLDTLRISWALLNDRHAALLRGLEPRYASSNDPDASMALVAGPMTTAEDAARVCSTLRARRITCSVVSFDGGKAL